METFNTNIIHENMKKPKGMPSTLTFLSKQYKDRFNCGLLDSKQRNTASMTISIDRLIFHEKGKIMFPFHRILRKQNTATFRLHSYFYCYRYRYIDID